MSEWDVSLGAGERSALRRWLKAGWVTKGGKRGRYRITPEGKAALDGFIRGVHSID